MDPISPSSSPDLLIDIVPPVQASTAARPPNYRRIAPIPPIRRSLPFSKRLPHLGQDRDTLAGDDGHCDCNSWPPTSSSSAASDEIEELTSLSSASDETQPSLTTSSSSVDPHQPSFTTQELWLVDLLTWFRSIILFVEAVNVIYNDHDCPAFMVSEIAGILCMYLYFWSMRIAQFWLNDQHYQHLSIVVFHWCFAIFMFAFLIGLQHGVLAGMCITLLATMCQAGFLIHCIYEYNCRRYYTSHKNSSGSGSGSHQDEQTLDS